MQTIAIQEAKAKHWEDLTGAISTLVSFWKTHLETGQKTTFGTIIDDPDYERVDSYLAHCLLAHLKTEFPEFEQVERWQNLLRADTKPELVRTLLLIEYRRTFEGICPICQGYEAAIPTMKTKDAVLAFMAYHNAEGSAAATMEHYGLPLNRFVECHSDLPTEPEPVEEFLTQWTGTTRRDYYKVIRSFYRWLNGRYGITDPTAKMKLPKAKRKVVASLSMREIERLLGQALSKRDKAALMVLVGCGLRVGEASNLKFGNIEGDRLKIQDGKTGGRLVPLYPEIKESLLALKDGHGNSDFVFWGEHPHQPLKVAGFQRLVKKAFELAQIEGKRASPHTLRHSFGRNWIAQGGDTISLKDILGHTNLNTTQIYSTLATEDLVAKNEKHNPLLAINRSLASADRSISPPDGNLAQ